MKILFHFRTQGTGAEGVHIAGIAQAFQSAGHEVIFSSPTGANPLKTAGENPFKAKEKSWLAKAAAHAPHWLFELLEVAYNAVAGMRNWRLIHNHRPGTIYERHAFFLCSTALLARWTGIPLVVEVNELAGDERIRAKPLLMPLARLADRITFHTAALICVVSPHLERRITELGIASSKIAVLPNGVTSSSIDAPSARLVTRDRLGIGTEVVIGFVGWFVSWHRLDLLLEVASRIYQSGRSFKILLVGDGPLSADLRLQAQQLGIEGQVIFTGAIPHQSVRDYIDAMDIAVVPHSNEYRSPIKLFEFMARARATIAPATEPVNLVIQNGDNGLLFPPLDADGFERQLRLLVENAEIRDQLGARAKASVVADHTWERNADAVLRWTLKPV